MARPANPSRPAAKAALRGLPARWGDHIGYFHSLTAPRLVRLELQAAAEDAAMRQAR